MNIRYLKQKDIDKQRWDACVHASICTHPYALSFFLDATTDKEWDAIIWNDYEAVFPLPHRSKLGVKYVFQPYYSQQLGIYSRVVLSSDLIQLFLAAIPSEFKYIDIHLNYTNIVTAKVRCNLVLDLSSNMDTIKSHFSTNLKRNIAKASKLAMEYSQSDDVSAFISFARLVMLEENKSTYDEEIFQYLSQLVDVLMQRKLAKIHFVKENGEWRSAVLLVKHRNRIINLVSINSLQGKDLFSSAFLLAQIIENHAAQPLLFDFEGSDVAGVKRFYMQFGAQEENYAAYKMNRLPALLRWMKK